MTDKTFCTVCGEPEELVWTGRYDRNTGEKECTPYCSADPCHTKHDKDYDKCGGFLEMLSGRIATCRKCGYKIYSDI